MIKKLLLTLIISFLCQTLYAEESWQKWDNYPKVPRITAKQVKALMLKGGKIVFIYAGYEVQEVVCGSYYIPYTLVPPSADGSKIKLKIPKDYWIMCY